MTPSLKKHVLRLALVGAMIEPMRLLLRDVLAEGERHELGASPRTCDVALVLVSWGDERRVIADARALVGRAPILAILPFSDEGLAERALDGGAQGWFALDTPFALLRSTLARLGQGDDPARGSG